MVTETVRSLGKWWGRSWKRLSTLPDSPHQTAKAFAIGVFVGVMPGLGPAAALVAAFLFRLRKTATLLGTLVTNSWTTALIYALSYRYGLWSGRLDRPLQWHLVLTFEEGWHEELTRVAPTILVIGLIISIFLAVISYFVIRVLLFSYKAHWNAPSISTEEKR